MLYSHVNKATEKNQVNLKESRTSQSVAAIVFPVELVLTPNWISQEKLRRIYIIIAKSSSCTVFMSSDNWQDVSIIVCLTLSMMVVECWNDLFDARLDAFWN